MNFKSLGPGDSTQQKIEAGEGITAGEWWDGCCFSVPSKKTGRCVGCKPRICLMQAVGVIICHTQLWQAWTDLVCIFQCRSYLLSLTASSLLWLSLWQNSQHWEWIMSTTLLMWTCWAIVLRNSATASRPLWQQSSAVVSVPFRVPYKPCAVCAQPTGSTMLFGTAVQLKATPEKMQGIGRLSS